MALELFERHVDEALVVLAHLGLEVIGHEEAAPDRLAAPPPPDGDDGDVVAGLERRLLDDLPVLVAEAEVGEGVAGDDAVQLRLRAFRCIIASWSGSGMASGSRHERLPRCVAGAPAGSARSRMRALFWSCCLRASGVSSKLGDWRSRAGGRGIRRTRRPRRGPAGSMPMSRPAW